MKVRAIAACTFGALVRSKAIILFCVIFLCVLALMTTPLTFMRNANVEEAGVLAFVAGITSLVSGFGSLLAAWAAAEAVAGEMKSGTILAVLARPVQRWEFLLGKYLGVQLLMLVYVAFLLGSSYALAAIGGQKLHAAPWILIVYPVLRYAIYSALAILFVTVMHPTLAFAGVLAISVLSGFLANPFWMPAYVFLPSMSLLSESGYLAMAQGSLKPIPWTQHATAIAYGLDYALVVFLLAAWSFRSRALTRD